ncbi:hypothetical protein BDD12DRAFT_57583 [Trichophaea hybrida]|nr:hypothetical protein BDD12DRAFT_57583 [Trichophaea hybrida]
MQCVLACGLRFVHVYFLCNILEYLLSPFLYSWNELVCFLCAHVLVCKMRSQSKSIDVVSTETWSVFFFEVTWSNLSIHQLAGCLTGRLHLIGGIRCLNFGNTTNQTHVGESGTVQVPILQATVILIDRIWGGYRRLSLLLCSHCFLFSRSPNIRSMRPPPPQFVPSFLGRLRFHRYCRSARTP